MSRSACARSQPWQSRSAASRWRCAHEKSGAPECAALQIHVVKSALRTGGPQAVIAEIGSRARIVGPVGLPAVGIVATAGSHRHHAVVGIAVVVIGGRGRVVTGPAVIPLRGNRAADNGTCDDSRTVAAATAVIGTTAAIAAAIATTATISAAITATAAGIP